MRKSKFSEGKIIGFLKQAEAGMAVAEICRKGDFSDPTFYKWRAKFGGMDVSEAALLKLGDGGIGLNGAACRDVGQAALGILHQQQERVLALLLVVVLRGQVGARLGERPHIAG